MARRSSERCWCQSELGGVAASGARKSCAAYLFRLDWLRRQAAELPGPPPGTLSGAPVLAGEVLRTGRCFTPKRFGRGEAWPRRVAAAGRPAAAGGLRLPRRSARAKAHRRLALGRHAAAGWAASAGATAGAALLRRGASERWRNHHASAAAKVPRLVAASNAATELRLRPERNSRFGRGRGFTAGAAAGERARPVCGGETTRLRRGRARNHGGVEQPPPIRPGRARGRDRRTSAPRPAPAHYGSGPRTAWRRDVPEQGVQLGGEVEGVGRAAGRRWYAFVNIGLHLFGRRRILRAGPDHGPAQRRAMARSPPRSAWTGRGAGAGRCRQSAARGIRRAVEVAVLRMGR